MAFKITDLDKFLKEDYNDFDDPTAEWEDVGSKPDIEGQMEKFADVPEDEVSDEEGAIPPEAAEEEGGFEMESDGEGYFVSQDGEGICSVTILCDGEPVDMATLEDPSKCYAEISNVLNPEKTEAYKDNLLRKGFNIKEEQLEIKELPESKNHLIDISNKWLEE